MPASLIIEGFAQVGGILVSQLSDFERKVVLAKINKSKFHFEPQPGDTLYYSAKLQSVQEHGAVTTGVSYRGEDLHAMSLPMLVGVIFPANTRFIAWRQAVGLG